MKITLHGGVGEIGGNKVLLEHKDTRIFLDFGMSFKKNGMFFSEFLNPRKCVGMKDFFEFNLLPDLEGIYREDYLKHMDRCAEEKSVDAVFLAHAHVDHVQFIHFLRKDIPIYCSEATKIILKALENTGSATFSDFLTFCDAYTFYENKKGNLSRVTRRNKDYVYDRDINVMEPESVVEVGSLKVEIVPVDHSLPGAAGYIVYSDEGNLVYTGDIRFHGRHGDLSKRFVQKAREAQPKWLVSEGTRIDSTKKDSEAQVKESISSIISEAKNLVFVEHPIRDIDRVQSMYEAAEENGREFVIPMKLAYLVEELGDLCPFTLDDVKILIPQKSWGLICKDGVDQKEIEKDYATWERDFIFRPEAITYKELVKNPNRYVVSMSMWDINQLTDIKPDGTIWIKSSCEPFSDEMEIDEERKKNWLKHFNIREYHAHASGHASGDEIKKMIKEINADEVIPIHTEHPELFD